MSMMLSSKEEKEKNSPVGLNEREAFYRRVVCEQNIDKSASILVCGAGKIDKQIFTEIGFNNVTLSNLDERIDESEYAPFRWKYENAEDLSFKDSSFDYVIIHAAIHHASSPHKVLTEMYRVAKRGVLAFEARDSVIMRIMEEFRFTQTYEHAAVYHNNCRYGGVNNTEIPNYVYRWTEREVEKVINSYAPYAKHNFYYRYGTAFPCTPEVENRGRLKHLFLQAVKPFYLLFVKLFPKQQNLFAFYVEKPKIPDNLFPWLLFDGDRIIFNRKWGEERYKNLP